MRYTIAAVKSINAAANKLLGLPEMQGETSAFNPDKIPGDSRKGLVKVLKLSPEQLESCQQAGRVVSCV